MSSAQKSERVLDQELADRARYPEMLDESVVGDLTAFAQKIVNLVAAQGGRAVNLRVAIGSDTAQGAAQPLDVHVMRVGADHLEFIFTPQENPS